MDTKVITVYADAIDTDTGRRLIAGAGEVIASGGLVAFPTETVYGLGGDATDATAARRIYEAKGRPSDNPLIVHICEVSQLGEAGRDIPPVAYALAEKFWPGPLTMIVKRSDLIPTETTGGLDTVAVRLPAHPVARELIRASGTYIAAPSANRSGRPSPTDAAHVAEDLSGRIDCIIDGGSVDIGLESTIVDLAGDMPTVLRPGAISVEEIGSVTGAAALDPGIEGGEDDRPPRAPGMKYRHYAPQGELTIIKGSRRAVADEINRRAGAASESGRIVAIIAAEETAGLYETGEVRVIGSLGSPDTIAHNLYRVLRELDALGAEEIYSESFGGEGLGEAIANRLTKAAGGRVIGV